MERATSVTSVSQHWGMEGEPFRLGSKGWAVLVSRAGLSSQLDGRLLAAVFVQHYVFTSMLSSHKSLRSLIMITFSVSFQPFEVLTGSFHTSNLLKNEISKLFFSSLKIFKEHDVLKYPRKKSDQWSMVKDEDAAKLPVTGLHFNGFAQW